MGKEMITHAAVISNTGMIFLGKCHADCFNQADNTGVETLRFANAQGFFTNKGKFVSREAAHKIALKSGQLEKSSNGILLSEDLWSPRHNGLMKYDSVKGYYK